MKEALDLKTWGPMTVLAVLVVLVVLLAGVYELVASDKYTFRGFIDDLKYIAAAFAVAVPIGRGIHARPRDQQAYRYSDRIPMSAKDIEPGAYTNE